MRIISTPSQALLDGAPILFACIARAASLLTSLHCEITKRPPMNQIQPGAAPGISGGISRRAVFQASAAALAASQLTGPVVAQPAAAVAPMAAPAATDRPPVMVPQVNGEAHPLNIDGRTSVLNALREHIGLKGS